MFAISAQIKFSTFPNTPKTSAKQGWSGRVLSYINEIPRGNAHHQDDDHGGNAYDDVVSEKRSNRKAPIL